MALIIALATVLFIPAWSHAAETQAPLAVPGEAIPISAQPAWVLRPATLHGTFRVPRTDTTLYVAAPWFVRDISVTLIGPGAREQTIVAESTLPGRTLGLRLPLDAPLADRIDIRASTVSAAGVPYLITADQLTTIGWRNWPYAAACGLFVALAILFGWFAFRARSRPCGWFCAALTGQAALMIPWLGIVRPPPQISQPLHGLVQAAVYIALAGFALTLFRGVRLGRDDADHRHRQLLLKPRQRRRGRGVARDEDQLHALLLEIGPDLAREAADLLERPRPVRQPRMVSEVDEVLVRHRHEALVEDGQAADSRVEHSDGARIHASIVDGR